MYLKSIKANGFKSFAEKTDLELTTGITGIVGPNGSGKSNVVDAIRWVLGEQSIKSLRGEGSMTDVIFQGSKSRNPAKRASVALTFDNSDHYLNSDFNELEIKRIVYETGENEYLINNTKVRLKDITDLFMDSGVDKEAFNIISQGEVTNIVNSKPHERRVIFESAASVLKYKKRKEESLRKLEKTKDNLNSIQLLINELEQTVLPLEEQAVKAKKYLELKDKLGSIEIALIVNDITDLNNRNSVINNELESLRRELDGIELTDNTDTSRIEALKLTRIKLEDEISNLNEEITKLNENIFKIDSEKRLNIERQKLHSKSDNINNIVNLKEDILNLKKNIEVTTKEINLIDETINNKTKELDTISNELSNLKIKYNTYLTKNKEYNSELARINNDIDIIDENINADKLVPYAVKSIINNPRLKKHDILGNLINYDMKYSKALESAIGFNYHVIVVDNEEDAKNNINYLKENKLGRATFFPINLIKPKFITEDIKSRISQIKGYIGIFSDLVSYDNIYEGIVKNQLGNVIVVEDLDSLNLIGRIVNYQYRIVTIDGDISHAGGSMTGGSKQEKNTLISEKLRLEELKTKKVNLTSLIETNTYELENISKEIEILNEKESNILKDKYKNNEIISSKKEQLSNYEYLLNTKESELNSLDHKDSLNEVVENLLKSYYEEVEKRDLLSKELNNKKSNLSELINDIMNIENEERKRNSTYNRLQSDIKNREVEQAKIDVKLDHLLITLNEDYNMTYDYALGNYELSIELEEARKEVHHLKLEIKDLGDVNTGSIEEYNRLNTRYEFLKNQEKDLNDAVNNLLGIINEMDEIMKDKFLTTFNQVKVEFSKVFKELFKGGEGTLRLTDPDNILETGIEILAVPPGKKISSNTLLSGGEKTLTAIALLFAILNVKRAPFCVLDEVEAALDEANVDMFGNFLKKKKDASQFIIITHKKRTMEYADYLYGITMQESGVSKLVSVKLENI